MENPKALKDVGCVHYVFRPNKCNLGAMCRPVRQTTRLAIKLSGENKNAFGARKSAKFDQKKKFPTTLHIGNARLSRVFK